MKKVILGLVLVLLLLSGCSKGKKLTCTGTVEGMDATITFTGEKPITALSVKFSMDGALMGIDKDTFSTYKGMLEAMFESELGGEVELSYSNDKLIVEASFKSDSLGDNFGDFGAGDYKTISLADLKAQMAEEGLSCK
ncbi:MAG: hypothetical protein LBR25_00490 [Erysipelotrichaceae bacterium]|jgi:hypothetical protein|nr:hypothetical protein [Erysipelotrichaceae bacterium]